MLQTLSQLKQGRLTRLPFTGSVSGRPFSVQDSAGVLHTCNLLDNREVEHIQILAHNSNATALDLTITVDEVGGSTPETYLIEINPKDPPVVVLELMLTASNLEIAVSTTVADKIMLTGEVVREERI